MPRDQGAGALTTLPLVLLPAGEVLLPAALLRVRLRAGSPLLRAIFEAQAAGGGGADVVAVPVPPAAPEDSAADDDDSGLDLGRLHALGAAARVVHLQRLPAAGAWAATLEGRHRCTVEGAELGPRGGPFLAACRQLDYFAAPPAGAVREHEALARKVLRALRALVEVAGAGGAPGGGDAARRAAALQSLARQSPALTADAVGALVARAPRDRLALLDAVDVGERLAAVLRLLDGAAASAAGRRAAPPPPPAERSAAAAARARVLAGGLPGGAAAAAGDSEDEEIDALAGDGGAARAPRALLRKMQAARAPAEALAAAAREARRLRRSSEAQPGHAAGLAYLEALAAQPWARRAAELPAAAAARPPSLAGVRAALDAAHAGLVDAKERIVQHVAVEALRGWPAAARAPVLLLVGPPGTGKTTLAAAAAAALRRPFARLALGGVRDEAELRGHRRTYTGALPGRVAAALARARCRDPVILLDEVDKLGRDAHRGDPAAALLEILDPEQNGAFRDHYLDVPLDLSRVCFIATANDAAAVPPALLDRLEVVRLGGYSLEEKLEIAAKHLVPRALEEAGLPAGALEFPPEAVRLLVEGYTREAGVRGLSRGLAAVCRAEAVRLLAAREAAGEALALLPGGGAAAEAAAGEPGPLLEAGAPAPRPLGLLGPGSMDAAAAAAIDAPPPAAAAAPVVVDVALLADVLGPPPRAAGADAAHRAAAPGAAAGLVWSEAGGAVQYIEAVTAGLAPRGRAGALTLTGSCGAVLEESAAIALSFVRANAAALGLPGGADAAVRRANLHLHLPAGAQPKDGPSAGVALAVALVSLFADRPVRPDVALTGELSLRGHVLPVGGLKEKLAAAAAAGVRRVIVPAASLAAAERAAPAAGRPGMEVVGAAHVRDALAAAFDPPLELEGGEAWAAPAPRL
jgi:ATP-dependent Lon protease